MKNARTLLDIALLVMAMVYMLNAMIGFAPGTPPDVSLGWACLMLLLILVRKSHE